MPNTYQSSYSGTSIDAAIAKINTTTIPTKLSDLTNDSGYVTSASVPTKVSDLTNDSGYITSASLPTKTSNLTNDSGFITSAAVPTKTSDLNNNSGFITFNQVYPVGAIYLSVNNTNPSTLFGGTWEQIQDTFLLAAGNTYSAGSTGGEAEHTLTVDEMPEHNHHILTNNDDFNNSSGGGNYGTTHDGASTWYQTTWYTENTGGGLAHNNMPPYLTVYMWKRTT